MKIKNLISWSKENWILIILLIGVFGWGISEILRIILFGGN